MLVLTQLCWKAIPSGAPYIRNSEALIDVVLTDNGSEFAGIFGRVLERAEVVRYYSRPRRPTDNPECERFNQTMQVEWLDQGYECVDAGELNRTLGAWLVTYNTVRPHCALGLRTPLVVAAQVGLVRARWETVLSERLPHTMWGSGAEAVTPGGCCSLAKLTATHLGVLAATA